MKHHQQYEAIRLRVSAGRVDLILTLFAGVLIIALTAAAFWLSYAHLHDVADGNGLHADPARAWAWPGTLDTFVVIGEVLMLRAGLRGVTDWWAVSAMAVGSVGSVVLNIVGVSNGASWLSYVVAAIPPSSAMLAFGLLMRQVHQIVGAAVARTDTASDTGVSEIGTASDTVAGTTDTAVSVAVSVVPVGPAVTDTVAPAAALAGTTDTGSGPVYLPDDTAVSVGDTVPQAVPVNVPAPVSVAAPSRVLICGPAAYRPRVLASDGAMDLLRADRPPVSPVVPLDFVLPAPSAGMDAVLAAARAARVAVSASDTVTVSALAETVSDGAGIFRTADGRYLTGAEETDSRPVPVSADTVTDTGDTGTVSFDTAPADADTVADGTDTDTDTGVPVPAPGGRLTDVELDAVVHMLRTETEPPRSYRAMEDRFRELGYTASAGRLRTAWGRVTTEPANV